MSLKIQVLLFIVFLAVLAAFLNTVPRPGPASYGQAQIGGSFTLTDTTGRARTDADFSGRLMLVYLGYTHCPDICPATLEMMSTTLKTLGPEADKVAPLFITLDPKHDTPEALGAYLKDFDPRITGLTGSPEDIKSVTHAYKAYASEATNTAPGNMIIDHSGLLYLMDRNGKYLRHFEHNVKSEELLTAIKQNL